MHVSSRHTGQSLKQMVVHMTAFTRQCNVARHESNSERTINSTVSTSGNAYTAVNLALSLCAKQSKAKRRCGRSAQRLAGIFSAVIRHGQATVRSSRTWSSCRINVSSHTFDTRTSSLPLETWWAQSS